MMNKMAVVRKEVVGQAVGLDQAVQSVLSMVSSTK